MNLENLPSNTNKIREEQPSDKRKVEKVVSGVVKTKKKSGISKLVSNVVSDDIPSIKSYIFKDIVIPTIKKAIVDTVDMIIYGGPRSSKKLNSSRVSYRSFYDEPRPRAENVTGPRYSHDDIILETRPEAEEVLSQLNDMIETYDMASVADLYDLVGISGSYTDNKYGWTNLRNAEVIRVRDGYLLKMPRALPLK